MLRSSYLLAIAVILIGQHGLTIFSNLYQNAAYGNMIISDSNIMNYRHIHWANPELVTFINL